MNIVYFGKYTLNKSHASAGTKRVLNQIRYLEKEHRVKVLTISKFSSDCQTNLNLTRCENNLVYLLTIPFYWLFVCAYLITNKHKGKNILLLESLVDLNSLVPVLLCRLIGYRVVHDVVENFFLEEEGSSIAYRANKLVGRIFYRFTAIYAAGIIVISEKLQKQYAVFGVPILKLYNSVALKGSMDDPATQNEVTTFLYSGTFGIKDGVKDFIHAFIKVTQDHENVRLVLTGRNESEYFQVCMGLIKNNRKISYLGYLDFPLLEKEYRNADVLLATRDNSEFADYGFPYKLSEYLSYGKPVIASAVSDIPTLFADFEDILLVDPSNIESIVNKMKFAIENKHLLAEISKKGFAKCNQYFSIDRIGGALSDFLTTI